MAYPSVTQLAGGGNFVQTPTGTPGQQQAREMMLQQGLQNFNPEAQEARARQQFQTQTLPGLAERFTAMGGGQRSSAFQGALGQAGADLESQLAAQRQNVGLQQLNFGLQPQFEGHLQQEYDPYSGFLQGLGSAAPQLLELGGKGLSSVLGGFGGKAAQAATKAAPSLASNIITSGAAGAAGAALPAAAASGGGFLSGLGGAAAAAAPFALPIAGAAAVIALPFLLSYLLGD